MESTNRAALEGTFDAVRVAQQHPMREDSQDGREGIRHLSHSEVPREVDLGLLDNFGSADVVV